MASLRSRKARNSTNDTLAILNSINKSDMRKRSHTSNDASVYDYPTRSPEPLRMRLRSGFQKRSRNHSRLESSQTNLEDYASTSNDARVDYSSQLSLDRGEENEDIGHSEPSNNEEAEEEVVVDVNSEQESSQDEEKPFEDINDIVRGAEQGEDEPSSSPEPASQKSSTIPRSQSKIGESEAGFDIPEQENNAPKPSPPRSALSPKILSRQANAAPPTAVEVLITNNTYNSSSNTHVENDLQHHSCQPRREVVAQQIRPPKAGRTDADNLVEHSNPVHSHPEPPQQTIYENPQVDISELDSWFDEEIEKGFLEEEWRSLRDHGRGLSLRISGYMPEYLQPAYQLIVELQNIHTNLAEELTGDLSQEVQNLNDAIYAEVNQALDFPASEKSNPFLASTVLFQLEGHLIPHLVVLIQLSFRVYRKSGDHAFAQFHNNLELLSKCCNHIYHLWNCGYISRETKRPRSLMLRLPLRRLREALEGGRLKSNVTTPSILPDTTHLVQGRWTEPWSEEEENYLSIGLERYEGNDRYLSIKRHMGQYLPRRTIVELRNKAQEIRLSLGANFSDPSSMPSWLASI